VIATGSWYHASLDRLLRATQRNLLGLLLGCYALGGLFPGPGVRLRELTFGTLQAGGATLAVSVPLALLGFLLFNAGFGANPEDVRQLWRYPRLLAAGLIANAALPVLVAFAVLLGMRAWPEPYEVQSILIGLGLIGAMPVAGASTAWAQNCNGNLALSLGLVVASTLASPLVTPAVLHVVQGVASGDYAEDLGELARSGTQLFLVVSVVAPAFAGLLMRAVLPARVTRQIRPTLKLANLVALLVLTYANAALALPEVVRSPDLDFLAIIIACMVILCVSAFWLGAYLARALGGSAADATSLMFGLGMNNNGAALVLASTALADHPSVMLPLLTYNLVQQVVAGVFDARARC